ncbi:hypothetical protein HYH03_003449 [Edaphochlamys debaryana]|uniref:Uncharacterized protein n=1 Tax=Edaphochlamys debaryana TaxID=47281 RepID=A0A835YJB1_9CHLO|nr:hypothetical protein HYH03_003449 [Edaphochlamys debaryana]|eukprot:KAG2498709.1 hypothetical protein HYH03_003449 [Edaphochlamys debaryana]
MIDVIALSTTWTRLGKFGVSGSRYFVVDPRALAFVRDALLSRTLARVPDMTVRQVSNVLWAMGKLRLKLAEEKNGQYLTEQIEARVLDLLGKLKQDGFKSPLDGPQLWLGLGMCQYEWSTALLRELLTLSLAEMPKWDAQGLSQTCMQMAKLCGDTLLTPAHKDQMKGYYVRLFSDAARKAEVAEMISSIAKSLNAMQLTLGPSDLEGLVSATMNVPLPIARARGLNDLTAALISCVDLGYQPSAQEAEAWLAWMEEERGAALVWLVWAGGGELENKSHRGLLRTGRGHGN